MKLTLVPFLAIFTVLESPVNGQIWPWEISGGSRPTPSTNIDGSDGGVISLNYAFDVNSLIPNGIRNWMSDGLAAIQHEMLNYLGSVGGANKDTSKMLNAFMSTVDQFAQSRGANADTLAAQLKALRQHIVEQATAQLQRSSSAVSQSNSALVPAVQALSENIVTQLSYLESIVSPTLPCASQAYSVLTEAARSGAQQIADCLADQNQYVQNTINSWLSYVPNFYLKYISGPDVYGVVQECNNNTGGSLLISNVTKSSACWAQAALQIKRDTIEMLYDMGYHMATSLTAYRTRPQISMTQCTYRAFDVFSTYTVNAGIQKLFTCAGIWTGSYDSTTSATK